MTLILHSAADLKHKGIMMKENHHIDKIIKILYILTRGNHKLNAANTAYRTVAKHFPAVAPVIVQKAQKRH